MERKEQRELLEKQAKALAKKKSKVIVLCKDGQETDNTYNTGQSEADGKSLADWINGIMFHWELGGKKNSLSLTGK